MKQSIKSVQQTIFLLNVSSTKFVISGIYAKLAAYKVKCLSILFSY